MGGLGLTEPTHESSVADSVVGEATDRAVAHPVSVEMVFRNIDANGILRHLSLVLCLSSEAKLRYPFRTKEKDEGDPTLARPVKRSAFQRSDPRR
jgi:hypothetical protein